VLAFSGSFFEC